MIYVFLLAMFLLWMLPWQLSLTLFLVVAIMREPLATLIKEIFKNAP